MPLVVFRSRGIVRFSRTPFQPSRKPTNSSLWCKMPLRTAAVRADRETILDGYHFPEWLRTISQAMAYIRGRPGIDPDRVALLGVSLGAFLALSIATDFAARIRAVVEISGGMPEPSLSAV